MFIADENLNRNLIIALRKAGYKVFSIQEEMPSIEDEKIALMSLHPPRIIISQDKDFGDIVYHKNLKVAGVILLRYLQADYFTIENSLINYIAEHLGDSLGKFVVINSRLIRIRQLPQQE